MRTKNKGYTLRYTYIELNGILLEHFKTCPHCDEREGIICAAAYELLAIITQRIGHSDALLYDHSNGYIPWPHIPIGEV